MKLFRSPVFAAALFLAGVAILQLTPAYSTLYKWSQTAGSNSNSDATINWAEGMAPSAVNDSARAMMAAIAKYRDDHAGSLTTGGTSTAYTVTTNQVFASLATMSGQSIRVKMSATNGASPTLNVDGLGAKNIVSVTGVAVATASLKSGAIYDFSYNNSSSEWFVVNYPTVPVGAAFATYMSACPSGWTKNSTAAIDNSAALLSTSAGGSTGGSTNFTSVFTSRTIAQGNLPNVTLTTTVTDPGHLHDRGNLFDAETHADYTGHSAGAGVTHVTAVNNSGGQTTSANTTGITASTALGGSGTAMDFAVKYSSFIVCTLN
jgi:hypothetical protein